MPVRIPKATAIPRAAMGASPGVVGIDTRDQGAGLGDLAQAMDEIAAQRDQTALAFAEADFLTYKTEQDNAHDDDEDYTQSTQAYTADMNTKLGELAEGISKPRLRNLFVKGQQPRLAEGIASMNTKVRARERDDMRARTFEAADQLLVNGAAAGGDLLAMTDAMKNVIGAGVTANNFSEQEGYKLIKDWSEKAALNKLAAMDPASVLVALEQPWAKNLSASDYQRIKKSASEEATLNWAQQSAEQFIASGMGPVDVNREIDKQPDAAKQSALQSAYSGAYARDKAALKEVERDTYEKYYEIVLDGASEGMPVDIFELRRQNPIEFARMSPEQTNRLIGQASDAAKGVVVDSTPYSLKSRMDTLIADEKWPEAQKMLDARQRDMRREDRDTYSEVISGKVSGSAKGFMTIKEKVRLGFPPGTEYLVQKALPLEKRVEDWYIQFQNEHDNKKPSDTEVQEKIDSLWVEHATDTWFGINTGETPRHQLTPAGEVDAMTILRDAEPEIVQLAGKYVGVSGVDPDNFDYMISATDQLSEMRDRDPEVFSIIAKRDALVSDHEKQYQMKRFTDEFNELIADEMDRRIIQLRESEPDLYDAVAESFVARNTVRTANGLPLESVSPEQFMSVADAYLLGDTEVGLSIGVEPPKKETKRRFDLQNLRWGTHY